MSNGCALDRAFPLLSQGEGEEMEPGLASLEIKEIRKPVMMTKCDIDRCLSVGLDLVPRVADIEQIRT